MRVAAYVVVVPLPVLGEACDYMHATRSETRDWSATRLPKPYPVLYLDLDHVQPTSKEDAVSAQEEVRYE